MFWHLQWLAVQRFWILSWYCLLHVVLGKFEQGTAIGWLVIGGKKKEDCTRLWKWFYGFSCDWELKLNYLVYISSTFYPCSGLMMLTVWLVCKLGYLNGNDEIISCNIENHSVTLGFYILRGVLSVIFVWVFVEWNYMIGTTIIEHQLSHKKSLNEWTIWNLTISSAWII